MLQAASVTNAVWSSNTTSNYTRTNFVADIIPGTGLTAVTNQGTKGKSVTLTVTALATTRTNIEWTLLTNLYHVTYFAPVDPVDTNATILSYTPTYNEFLKIETLDVFDATNAVFSAFDGQFQVGLRWTDIGGYTNRARLAHMPNYMTSSDYNYGENTLTNYWYGGTYFLNAKSGKAVTITNRVIISWSPGDMVATNHLYINVFGMRTNIYTTQ